MKASVFGYGVGGLFIVPEIYNSLMSEKLVWLYLYFLTVLLIFQKISRFYYD